MKKLIVLLALCTAACSGSEEGQPPSAGEPDPVVSDTAKQDNTGPNGIKTGG